MKSCDSQHAMSNKFVLQSQAWYGSTPRLLNGRAVTHCCDSIACELMEQSASMWADGTWEPVQNGRL